MKANEVKRVVGLLKFIAEAAESARQMILCATPLPPPPSLKALVMDIADAKFPDGDERAVPVRKVLTDPLAYREHGFPLESEGIALTQGRRGQRNLDLNSKSGVFVNMAKVRRTLLVGTTWNVKEAENLLLLLPEASREQRMIDGHRIWGIEVPLESWHAASGDLPPEDDVENRPEELRPSTPDAA